MSYGITCYFNDETIARTIIYNDGTGEEYVRDYGDSKLSYTGYTGYTRFTARAAPGCSFVSWTYRLGSLSNPAQKSYSNPFIYSGSQNIYIHADGIEDDSSDAETWTLLSKGSISSISSEVTKSLSLSAGYVYRYSLTFANSGEVEFKSTGGADTYGYLSTSSNFDSDEGGPTSALIENDDDFGYNFGFTYSVIAGKTYYLWVRCYGISESGSATIYITPSESITSLSFSNIKNTVSSSGTVLANGVVRIAVTFAYSGSMTFYTTGSTDTYGYIGTSSSWDSSKRAPSSYIDYNDDGGSGNNCKIIADVKAGTTYYLWARYYSKSTSGTISFCIEPPSLSSSIARWSWTSSNGNASAMATQTAYNALTTGGTVSDFSYVVWNDMVDKVMEIIEATGSSWNTSRATYANTRMSASDKTLTATRFNSLRYNIGLRYSTGIYDVKRGDTVYASYFITLANCINGWIDSI